MTRRRMHWADDRGESLVEILVALVILGIAGVAILAGMQMSVQASDIHRKQTTSGAYVRSYAEAIQNFVAENPGAFRCSPDYSAGNVGFSAPAGYTPTYTMSALGGGGAAAACSTDTVQLVRLTLSSTDGRADEHLSFVLRRPCAADQAVCT